MTKVDELLIEGKVKEAIEIMCDLPEYEKEREQYIDLFENEHYRQYEVDGILNEILLAYQQYFRDVFYCNSDEEIANLLKYLPYTALRLPAILSDKTSEPYLSRCMVQNTLAFFRKVHGSLSVQKVPAIYLPVRLSLFPI